MAAIIPSSDDFIVLCNGSKQEALKFKQELAAFLRNTLHLELSEEKTLMTHVNDGSFHPVSIKPAALIIFGLVRSVTFFYETDKSAEETAEEVFSLIGRAIIASP